MKIDKTDGANERWKHDVNLAGCDNFTCVASCAGRPHCCCIRFSLSSTDGGHPPDRDDDQSRTNNHSTLRAVTARWVDAADSSSGDASATFSSTALGSMCLSPHKSVTALCFV